MKQQHPADTPIWPYVSVVACLFLLSVLAAESWQTSGTSSSLRRYRTQVPVSNEPEPDANVAAVPTLADATAPAARRSAFGKQDFEALQPRGESARTDIVLNEPVLVGPAQVHGPDHASPRADVATTPTPATPAEPTTPIEAVTPRHAQTADSLAENPVLTGPAGVTTTPVTANNVATSPAQANTNAVPDTVDPELVATSPEPESTPAARPSAEAVVEPFAAPEKKSEFAGPVAEQIQLDVSVGEKPVLPATRPRQDVAVQPSRPLLGQRLHPVPNHDAEADSIVSAWPVPAALLEMLEALEQEPLSAKWAREATQNVHAMSQIEELSSAEIDRVLDQLQRLSNAANRLAQAAESDTVRVEILRAGYAIERRSQVWEQIHRVAASPTGSLVSVGFVDIEPVLDEANIALGTGDVARGWRKYLLMDQLYDANSHGDAQTQHTLARRVLRRMESQQYLREEQRRYLDEQPFRNLAHSLRRWAREPINFIQLLDDIESYELRQTTAAATSVASVYQQARWSTDRSMVELSDSLNSHYRNANLRVAATAELINRLLPKSSVTEEEVDENILGAYVYGTSRTRSKLRVALVPDPGLWRLGLEAVGEVESDTAATKGPATFYNQGFSEFEASKTLIVDAKGVKVYSAEAEAESETELRGLETEFDTMPVFGLLARSIARQKHNTRVQDAQREADARLEARARARLDEEVHRRLEEVENEFQRRILGPLNELQLQPSALDMHTTAERLVIRYRVAGTHQLAAHTPRPQAPSDSLLSVQIHDTVLNNTIQQLKLSAKQTDLRSLYSDLSDHFESTKLGLEEEIPEDVQIRFARVEPLRIQFIDGRVMLTMRIAELSSGHNQWRNFAIRVYYGPDPSQLEANLVREGVIELAGQRLRLGDQIALRGIFSRVFSKNRPVSIINKRLAGHPHLADLQVTQFVISDGWIGVALGPHRGGELQHLARDPSRKTR